MRKQNFNHHSSVVILNFPVQNLLEDACTGSGVWLSVVVAGFMEWLLSDVLGLCHIARNQGYFLKPKAPKDSACQGLVSGLRHVFSLVTGILRLLETETSTIGLGFRVSSDGAICQPKPNRGASGQHGYS